ncbi:unnamed protein product, partial [Linum tenue]
PRWNNSLFPNPKIAAGETSNTLENPWSLPLLHRSLRFETRPLLADRFNHHPCLPFYLDEPPSPARISVKSLCFSIA